MRLTNFKEMKTVLLIIACIIFPKTISAQTSIEALEDIAGVEMVIITKDAFNLLLKFNPEKFKEAKALHAFQVLEGLEELKIFTAKNPESAKIMTRTFLAAINEEELTALEGGQEDPEFVKIYGKLTADIAVAKKVILYKKERSLKDNSESATVVILLKGNIPVYKTSRLVNLII